MAKKDLLFDVLGQNDQPPQIGFWQRLAERLSRSHEPVNVGEQAQAPPASKLPSPTETATVKAAEVSHMPTEPAPVIVPINVFTLTVAVVALGVCFIAGNLIGRRQGVQERGEKQVEDIQNKTPQPGVLESPADEPLPVPAAPSPPQDVTGVVPPASEFGENLARKVGLNYLIIHSFGERASADPVRLFLEAKDISTTIERKGTWYKLVSTVGFDLENPDDKARSIQFRNEVKAVGQQYKLEPGSRNLDFHDCGYDKWPLD
jgi:hypothetical protein